MSSDEALGTLVTNLAIEESLSWYDRTHSVFVCDLTGRKPYVQGFCYFVEGAPIPVSASPRKLANHLQALAKALAKEKEPSKRALIKIAHQPPRFAFGSADEPDAWEITSENLERRAIELAPKSWKLAPLPPKNELVHVLGEHLMAVANDANPKWTHLYLVGEVGASHAGTSGRLFLSDGSSDGLRSLSLELVLRLHRAMAAEKGQEPWRYCLVQVTKQSGEINLAFEYAEENPWAITAANHKQRVLDLAPGGRFWPLEGGSR